MKLQDLQPAMGSAKKAYRKGRGAGSGNGKTAGRGHKGRLPKRGFNNIFGTTYAPVSVSALERFDNGTEVTTELLLETGIISKALDGVKILGSGELTKNLTVKAAAFSASAKEKIEKAGGKAEVI